MSTSNPLVTIAIPTFNRLAYLQQAIDSSLRQTYASIEVIVSDNVSADGTADYVASLKDARMRFVRQEVNLGMLGNWNACLALARGEYFILLSDDDYLEPRAIEALVGVFTGSERTDEIGVAYCRTIEVNSEGAPQRLDPDPPPEESAIDFAIAYFQGRRKMHPCSTLFRTADVRSVGGYTQGSVVLAVDAMVWSRILLQRGRIGAASETLANYRIHSSSLTSSHRIDVWRQDLAAFTGLWSAAARNEPLHIQRHLQRAIAHYTSWELAAIINQSGRTVAARFKALRNYVQCRREFASAPGVINLLGGLMKLFVPELIKRPLRNLLLRMATSSRTNY